MISIENLVKEGKVEKVDENDELCIYSYIKCDNTSDDNVKQSRGMVYNKNGELVTKSFPFVDTITSNDEKVKDLIKSTSKAFYVCEGTIIRVFWYNGVWYISTNRKLDATKSFWSSKISFGNLFRVGVSKIISKLNNTKNSLDDDLEVFFKMLDKKLTYFFAIKSTEENKIVCNGTKPNEPKLYYIGDMDISGNINFNNFEFFKNIGFNYYPEIKNLTLEQIPSLFSQIDYKSCPGIIVFNNNIPTKIVSKKYLDYFNARGNEANIIIQYFNLRNNKEQLSLFYELYPEYLNMFNYYEECLYAIGKYIHKKYIARYVNKNFVIVQQEEFHVMQDCHKWYQENPKNRIVTLDVVMNTIEKQEGKHIFAMTEHYKHAIGNN